MQGSSFKWQESQCSLSLSTPILGEHFSNPPQGSSYTHPSMNRYRFDGCTDTLCSLRSWAQAERSYWPRFIIFLIQSDCSFCSASWLWFFFSLFIVSLHLLPKRNTKHQTCNLCIKLQTIWTARNCSVLTCHVGYAAIRKVLEKEGRIRVVALSISGPSMYLIRSFPCSNHQRHLRFYRIASKYLARPLTAGPIIGQQVQLDLYLLFPWHLP